MSCLAGKVAIVTGGGSGIGLAVARDLAKGGVHVTICGRRKRKLDAVIKKFKDLAGDIRAVSADVSRSSDARKVVKATLDRHRRIDFLVNNAGVFKQGNLDSFSEADWDETMAVNLKGAFLFSRAVLPHMKRRREGYIVNISSLAGKMGMEGGAAYSASKFGMNGLTESLSEEGQKHNIRATAICPAYVATPMVRGVSVPFRDMIQPEDISSTVLYLFHLSSRVIIKDVVLERQGAD